MRGGQTTVYRQRDRRRRINAAIPMIRKPTRPEDFPAVPPANEHAIGGCWFWEEVLLEPEVLVEPE